MDLKKLTQKAKEIKEAYSIINKKKGNKKWSKAEYLQGFIGDVGDLSKLILAKNNYRKIPDFDKKIAHELSDCLWSILIIADELNLDLESEFINSMEELKKRIK